MSVWTQLLKIRPIDQLCAKGEQKASFPAHQPILSVNILTRFKQNSVLVAKNKICIPIFT
jgi:hypothetical protein